MNKLVSKNLIQRFKEGRKIVKALKGTQFGKNVQIVYYMGRDGKDYEAVYNPQAKKWMYANRGQKNYQFMPEGYTTHDGYNFNGDFAIVSNQKNKQGVQKSFINKQQKNLNKTSQKKNISNSGPLFGWKWEENNYKSNIKPRNLQQTTNKLVDTVSQQNTNNKQSTSTVKPVQITSSNKYSGSSVRDYSQQPKKTTNVVNKTSSVKTVTPVDNYYLKGFENRKDEIAKLGGVKAVQKMLGFTAGNGLDGKWGDNTEKAYQKYLIANAAKTPSLEDTINAAQNQPILSTPTINPSEYTFTESQLSGLGENPYYEPNPELRFNNFDRTQTRQWLRDNGFNPYSLTGAQRKALRMILNGQGTNENKNLIGLTNGLSEILTNYKYLKQGGYINKLPSKNIVERFRQRNFR